MKTSQILLATGVISSGLCLPFQTEGKPVQSKKPNIIYILADDLGYGDVSTYNPDSKISTPNFDRLAMEGICFTDAHSPSAVCTPTRYGILTGRYSWRSPLKSGVLNGYSQPLIEKDRTTVASFLKRNGYHTGIVGKWHLGLGWVQKPGSVNELSQTGSPKVKIINPETIDFSQPPTDGPMNHGFDYSYILPASLDMPPYCFLENNKLTASLIRQTPGNNPDNATTGPFWREGLMAEGFAFEQVTPTFTQKAVLFIREQASLGKPFFLYLPFPSPHTPWLPLPGYNGTSKAGPYGDFVQMLDAHVGEILKALTETGLDDNTIVFFTSDNGPFWKPPFIDQFGHKAASIYRGMKADAFEGGHRVPFIVRWPGKIKPGIRCAEPITLTSLLATCAELINKNLSENEGEDSFSILPLLLVNGKKYKRPKALIQHSSKGIFVVRQGDWKLILGLGSGGFSKPEMVSPGPNEAPGQLYNLKKDPSEVQNLYLQFPQKVEKLKAILELYQEAERSR